MSINNAMYFYTCATLVDITATGVIRHTVDKELERNQQRNWETVLQCIGLKAQPQLIEGPIRRELEIDDNITFGDIFLNTKQLVWIFSFGVEAHEVFMLNNDPVGHLDKDFAQVPIICGLEETARFMLPIFYPYGSIKNICFMAGRMNL